ncbi:hypothetical protein C8R45DRAFT_315822 [Mycena sanguinolenta]|nr:hypothetical protein C8R45DRAFT_315822 [Mycena sanguinolenta]
MRYTPSRALPSGIRQIVRLSAVCWWADAGAVFYPALVHPLSLLVGHAHSSLPFCVRLRHFWHFLFGPNYYLTFRQESTPFLFSFALVVHRHVENQMKPARLVRLNSDQESQLPSSFYLNLDQGLREEKDFSSDSRDLFLFSKVLPCARQFLAITLHQPTPLSYSDGK